MTRKISASLCEVVKNYLDTLDIDDITEKNDGLFHFRVKDKSGVTLYWYTIDVYDKIVDVTVTRGLNVETENRARVAELITRINFGLSYGHFEMDYHTGSVNYRTFVYCYCPVPTNEVIDYIFRLPGTMWNHYIGAFLSVLYDGADPEFALEEALLNPSYASSSPSYASSSPSYAS